MTRRTPHSIKQRKIQDYFYKSAVKPTTYSIQSLLEKTPVSEILENCPVLDKTLNLIVEQHPKMAKRLQQILPKFFHSPSASLWSDKYRPATTEELFSPVIVQKFKTWLQAFAHYRNNVMRQNTNSFIVDDYEEYTPQLMDDTIKQNKWKCKALILQGKSSVGKATLIKVVSRHLNYTIHQCAVDLNQQKYLKQNNQSTKSQNVSIMPKNKKEEKNNKKINDFAKPIINANLQIEEEKSQKSTLQLIRNLNLVYPEQNREQFYRQLSKSIVSSKIPFIMTITSLSSSIKLPQQFDKYDILPWEDPNLRKVAQFFWIICFLQRNFHLQKNSMQVANKDDLWKELNNQMPKQIPSISFQFQEIQTIFKLFGGNFSIIFNFLQFRNHNNLEVQISQFLKRITPSSLVEDQIDLNLLREMQKKPIIVKTLNQSIRQLDIDIISDVCCSKNRSQTLMHQKLFPSSTRLQQNLIFNISTNSHFQAKKRIINNLNKMFREEKIKENKLKYAEVPLRLKQIVYLPMLFVHSKHNTRKQKHYEESLESSLRKYLSPKQVYYLLQFH